MDDHQYVGQLSLLSFKNR